MEPSKMYWRYYKRKRANEPEADKTAYDLGLYHCASVRGNERLDALGADPVLAVVQLQHRGVGPEQLRQAPRPRVAGAVAPEAQRLDLPDGA